jgi:hypothetical protein
MSRLVRVSQDEADALREARFRCRMDNPTELLLAALEGKEAALEALQELWPPPSESGVAWEEITRLGREKRAATRRLDFRLAMQLQEEIQSLKAMHPERPRVCRDQTVAVRTDVVRRLLKLAVHAPRTGPGRPSVADGIRVLINGLRPTEEEGDSA